MRVYVLGDADTVLGFSLIGVEGYATTDAADAEAHLQEVRASGDVGLILVTDDLAEKLRNQITQIRLEAGAPLVLEVPAPGQRAHRESLSEALKRAIGVPL